MDLTEEIQNEMLTYHLYNLQHVVLPLEYDNAYVLKVITCFCLTILLNYARIRTQNFKCKDKYYNKSISTSHNWIFNFSGIY